MPSAWWATSSGTPSTGRGRSPVSPSGAVRRGPGYGSSDPWRSDVLSPSVVLLAACRLPDPATWDDGSDARIAVDRPEISFPTVDVGDDEPVIQRLTVKNVGTDPLTVQSPDLVRGTDFRVAAPIGVTLDPGTTSTYDITFDPWTAFEHEDIL